MKRNSFYLEIGRNLRSKVERSQRKEEIRLGETIRRLRTNAGLGGAELCRKADGLDPRLLSAIEKGRIRNPSLETLQAIARGLGCLVRDLFTDAEMSFGCNYYLGSQKGEFRIEFPKQGLTVISLTPATPYFFCGKMILAPQATVENEFFSHPLPLFMEVVMGKVEIHVEKQEAILKEGENIFFNGRFSHSLRNLLSRESALRLVTAPSFFSP